MVSGEMVELQGTSPFAAESFAELDRPWALDFEPGTGRVFITEKGGTLKVMHPGTGVIGTVTGEIPSVVDERQGGLGDIVFGPNYADDGHVYLSWAQDAGGGMTVAAVGRGVMSCSDDAACTLSDFSEIWRQSRPAERKGHYSHRIVFSPDGQHMYVASGDRQEQDPAQNLDNNLGTIVRLNLDGTPAAGNPLAGQGSPRDQYWSWGHRNILGMAFAPDGELWEVEHGPAGGDELNRVMRGANYGWPTRSYGENYNGDPIPDHSADDGFAQPAIWWTPVIAPGGMIIYDGSMFADWRGQALIANLRTTSISRVTLNASANSANEASRYEFPERLRDIAQAPDGAIWVIEDGEGGRLMRLTPGSSD
ncbi:PQQ-dependent oxidoreductase, gdhB family [Aurantiacibacter gangjinensis]|nr:PQQ-dependent oxidoreductase, gdhB family [Aurantiacibacter gangjinensis]